MNRVLEATLAITAISSISLFGFTRKTRERIWERAKGRSELSGANDRPLQCSHINHYNTDYKHPNYDSKHNAMLLTDIEHLAYHLYFRETPETIGMCFDANEWAIDHLQADIKVYDRGHGIRPEETQKNLELATRMWDQHYARES